MITSHRIFSSYPAHPGWCTIQKHPLTFLPEALHGMFQLGLGALIPQKHRADYIRKLMGSNSEASNLTRHITAFIPLIKCVNVQNPPPKDFDSVASFTKSSPIFDVSRIAMDQPMISSLVCLHWETVWDRHSFNCRLILLQGMPMHFGSTSKNGRGNCPWQWN